MPLLTTYPTWVKILFSILWIVVTLAVIFVWFSKTPQKENTESITLTYRTPLYEKTKQKIDDFYTNLDRDQLTPWMFFRIGKMRGVKDYYGKPIFEGGGGWSGVGEVNDSGADMDIYRLLAVPFDRLRTGYVSLLAPKGQANIGVL